jgi:spermidine synthase
VRTLHVGGEAIQSAMRLAEPFALALDYTRCMMAFLLFHPQPREALMIGLGGGSLAKFFHRNLKATNVRAVELDGRIVAAARAQFSLPANDARLRVEVGDGLEALSPECCDVLILDAFDDERHVQALATQAFYDAAFLSLAEQGAMVVNFMDDDPKFDQSLQRLEKAFGGAVLAMKALYDPNVIAIGLKGFPARVGWDALEARAVRLEARLGLPFRKYISRLRGMNRGTRAGLILAVP